MEILIWVIICAGYLYFMIKYLDLAVTLFICAVTLFSRNFVHLHFPGTPLYVTELFLLFTLISVAIKIHKTKAFKWPDYKLRNLFLILYLIAAVSLVRGMLAYSDRVFVVRHAALFYYSILYFLLPIVYDDMEKIKRFCYCFIASCAVVAVIWLLKLHFVGLGDFGNVYLAMAILLLAAVKENNRFSRWAFFLMAGFGTICIVDSMVRAVWVAVIGTILFVFVTAIFNKRFRKVAINIVFKGVPVASMFVVGYFFLYSQNFEPFITKILTINPMIRIEQPRNENAIIVSQNKQEIQDKTSPKHKSLNKSYALAKYFNEINKEGKEKLIEISEKSHSNLAAINTRWRIICWQDIISESMQRPYLGWGFGKIFIPETIAKLGWGGSWKNTSFGGNQVGFQDPHNSYLSVLHRTGFIGLGVFLAIFLYFVFATIKFIVSSPSQAPAYMALGFLLVFMFISGISMFMVVLEGPFLGIFCWLSMGFVEAITNISNKGEQVEQ